MVSCGSSASSFARHQPSARAPRSGIRIRVLQLALERTRIQLYSAVFSCGRCLNDPSYSRGALKTLHDTVLPRRGWPSSARRRGTRRSGNLGESRLISRNLHVGGVHVAWQAVRHRAEPRPPPPGRQLPLEAEDSLLYSNQRSRGHVFGRTRPDSAVSAVVVARRIHAVL